MLCWHCKGELKLNHALEESHKFYHCSNCDAWYEMFKEKERVNGAVPVRFNQLEAKPPIPASANRLAA